MRIKFLLVFCALWLALPTQAQPSIKWFLNASNDSVYNSKIADFGLDSKGNVISIGTLSNIADLDPSPLAQDTALTKRGDNFYISKVSPSGKLIWVKFLKSKNVGTSFVWHHLVIDHSDNIIVTSGFFGVMDYDPSAAEKLFTSRKPTYNDFVFAKYNPSGDLLWANSYGTGFGSSTEEITGLNILPDNRIIALMTSLSLGIDMDPSPAIRNSGSSGTTALCYNSDGSLSWLTNFPKTTSYPVKGRSFALGSSSELYAISIGYYETTITKLDTSGRVFWNKTIGKFSDGARVNSTGIIGDKSGGFVLYGDFLNTVDFEPGTKVKEISTADGFDTELFIASYDSSGNLHWINTIKGQGAITDAVRDGNELWMSGNITGTINLNANHSINGASSTLPGGYWFQIGLDGTYKDAVSIGAISNISRLAKQDNYLLNNGTIGAGIPCDIDFSSKTTNIQSKFGGAYLAAYTLMNPASITGLKNQNLMAYPNPAQDFINISSSKSLTGDFQVMNLTGEVVISGKFSDTQKQNTIQISNLSPGIYYFSANSIKVKFVKY
jgi:hypothetical protein